MATDKPWSQGKDGIRLRLRLTPKSSRNAIEGVTETADGQALAARVRAVPEDGKANSAAETLVADWLVVARSTVTLVAGHKSRVKMLAVQGDPAALTARAEALLSSGIKATKKGGTP